jgi:RNA polymerase sigma factor (sigma-70 family)
MGEHDEWLAERFEEHRARLRAVAYRMLGSTSEAEDAVQEAWLRLVRSGADGIENLGGWLTTVVARVCLNMLRSRRSRREESLEGPLGEPLGARVPDPIVGRVDGTDPEHEALLADSVGLALLVVLETLSPAERLAFVLHDTFGVPFGEIAPIVGRSPAAARQLASRARSRVRGRPRTPTQISAANGRSSTPSSPRRAAATSTRSWRCSIRTSCSGQTPEPRARRGWSGARAPWPGRRSPSRSLLPSRGQRSSTGPRDSSRPRGDGHSR